MLTSVILRVEHFTSKSGKPCHIAWFFGDNNLPVKDFCPDWVEKDMICNIYTVPDFRCNATHEFELVK